MRSIDEQMTQIRQRSEKIKKEQRQRRRLFGEAGAACACLVLIVLAAAMIPNVGDVASGGTQSDYGSLVLSGPFISHVIIGLLAFALGVCFTLLCYHLRYRGK